MSLVQAVRATEKIKKDDRRYDTETDTLHVISTKKRKDMQSITVIKKEEDEIRSFCRTYGKGVTVGGVRNMRKGRPGARPLACRKSFSSTIIPSNDHQMNILEWLRPAEKQTVTISTSAPKRAKKSSTKSAEECEAEFPTITAHRVTPEGLEYLVNMSDKSFQWMSRDDCDMRIISSYMRDRRNSRKK